MEGYIGHHPEIKKLLFDKRGYLGLELHDKRIVYAPISKFPSLKKLQESERKKYSIIDMGRGLMWDKCNEVYHIQDFLGIETDYAHS